MSHGFACFQSLPPTFRPCISLSFSALQYKNVFFCNFFQYRLLLIAPIQTSRYYYYYIIYYYYYKINRIQNVNNIEVFFSEYFLILLINTSIIYNHTLYNVKIINKKTLNTHTYISSMLLMSMSLAMVNLVICPKRNNYQLCFLLDEGT